MEKHSGLSFGIIHSMCFFPYKFQLLGWQNIYLHLLPQLRYYHNTHLKSYVLFLVENFTIQIKCLSTTHNLCKLPELTFKQFGKRATSATAIATSVSSAKWTLNYEFMVQGKSPTYMRKMSKQLYGAPCSSRSDHRMCWQPLCLRRELPLSLYFLIQHRLRRKYFSQQQKTHFIL